MKKIIFYLILGFSIVMNLNAEENPLIFFNGFDKTIDAYSVQSINIESQLSEGQLLFIYSQNDLRVFRTELFSSVGQTVYTSYYDLASGYWYIEKKAFFYNEPFKIDGADIETSYYKFNGSVYKYDKGKNLYIQNLDINTSPAVVDFRTAKSVIKLNENYELNSVSTTTNQP